MLVSMLRMNILLGYKVRMIDGETSMYFLAKDHAPSLALKCSGSWSLRDEAMSADEGFSRLSIQGIEVMRRQYDDDAQTGRSKLGIVIRELCPRRCERADCS